MSAAGGKPRVPANGLTAVEAATAEGPAVPAGGFTAAVGARP